MQFTLRDLLLLCVVLASALATFEILFGIMLFILIIFILTWRRSTLSTAKSFFLLLIIIWGLFSLGMYLVVTVVREGMYSASCNYNLKQIAIALLDYQAQNKHLPLAHTEDAQGRRLHSWRTMILPILDRKSLYSQLDLNESWDGPRNKKTFPEIFPLYACHDGADKQKSNVANYVAITGPNTLWPDDRPGDLVNISDGASNTILAIEIGQSDIAWNEPRDLTLNQMEERLNLSDPEEFFSWHGHREGFYLTTGRWANVLFADGTVRGFSKGALRKYLKALVTPNGGEQIDANNLEGVLVDSDDPPRLNWPWIATRGSSLIIFIASSLLLLVLPVKKWPQSTTPDHNDQAGGHDPLSD